MMTYMENEGYQNFERVQTETPMHTPPTVPNVYHTKTPTCMVSYMEEVIMIRVKSFENLKIKTLIWE